MQELDDPIEAKAAARVAQAFNALMTSEIPAIDGPAAVIEARLRPSEEPDLYLFHSSELSGPLIDFQVVEVVDDDGDPVSFEPSVVFNPGEVMGADGQELASDLVYAVGLAMQYPDQGYEGHLYDAHTKALTLRNQWRQVHGFKINADPIDREREIFRRMKDAFFHIDVGINDWRQQLELYKDYLGEELPQIAGDTHLFINLRQHYIPPVYTQLLSTTDRSSLLSKPSEVRAELGAVHLAHMATREVMKHRFPLSNN